MPSIYIMIELCYFSLDQWEIKIHLLWGICFNIPHWPRSQLTNGRLQHIKELVRLGACDPHLDQTKLNDLVPLTIDGVLVTHHSIAWRNFSDWIFSQQKTTDWKKKGQTCDKFWSLYPELNVWGLESADSDITPHFGWKTKWTPEFFLFLSYSEAAILPWFSNRVGRTKMLKHLNQLSSGYYLQLNKTKSQKSLRPLKPWSSQFTRAHHTHTGQIIWR